MPMTGFYVLITGALIGFIAFVFADLNMSQAHKNFDTNPFGDNNSVFGRHIGAMGIMALGGLIGVMGIILAIMDAIAFYG